MDPNQVAFVLNRIDLAATFLFSMTGAMVAIRRKYDFVGLFVLALCTGIGGGLLRDGLFIQDGPPAAMRSANYLWVVLAGCLTAALFQRSVRKLNRLFLYADALGLAAYGGGRIDQGRSKPGCRHRPRFLLELSMPPGAA